MYLTRNGKRWKLAYVTTAILILTIACSLPFSLGGADGGGGQPTAPQDDRDGGGLRCEEEGYPCSYGATATERISRSLSVMDLADEVYAEGGNAVDVAQRLQEEPDVVEMYYDERGVWYRVDGAPPMVFLHPDTLSGRYRETGQVESPQKAAKVFRLPIVPEPDGPVGENPPGQKAKKKAHFIAPFAWEFGTDVYDGVRPLLQDHRDFDCPDCITLSANQSKPKDALSEQNPSAGPSVEQFRGWEDYDLVHILAHGFQFCPGKSVTSNGNPVVSGDRENLPEDTAAIIEGANVSEGSCVSMLTSGHVQIRSKMEEESGSTPGLVWGHEPGGDVWVEMATTDFFKAEYPQGLDDTILFLSGCQLLRDDSLASVFLGSNTAVLGWSESVLAGRGEPVAVRFFEELVSNGLRSSKAYQKTIKSPAHTNHSQNWLGAELELERDGDPRGREVVSLIHPAFRVELEEGDSTVTQGVVKDDEADHLYVAARIDGVDEEQTPEDFEVHVRLNGEEMAQTFTAESSQQVDQYSYLAQGAVMLPYDVTNRETVAFEVWVELPEGGETRHVLNEVKPLGCGWTGTMSGVASGEYKGLIMDYQDVAGSLESGEMSELLGGMGNTSGLSGMGELTSALGKVWLLTFDRSDQFVGMLAPETGISSLPTLDTELLGYNTQSLRYQQTQAEEGVITGSFSGAYHGLKLEGTEITRTEGPTFEGEFVYHEEALCSMEVMMPILEHYSLDGPFGP